MKKILTIGAAALLLILLFENRTSVVVERTAAQQKGSITGEVFLREKPEDGPGSLLVKVDNECKKYPCRAQDIEEVKVTFSNIDFEEMSEMPVIPRFEDSPEYKDFIRTFEQLQKELDEPIRPGEGPFIPVCPEVREPVKIEIFESEYEPDNEQPLLLEEECRSVRLYNKYFSSDKDDKVEKDEDKLIFRFTFRHGPEEREPVTAVRTRATIPYDLLDQMENKKARVEVTSGGKTIFDKKIKPQKLPQIEVRQTEKREVFLPDTLVPGKPAYASIDPNLIAANQVGLNRIVGWVIKKGRKAASDPRKLQKLENLRKNFRKLLIYPFRKNVRGVVRRPVTAEDLKKQNQNKNRSGRTRKKSSATTVGPKRPRKIGVVILPPPEAEPGDEVGVTIFNEFGEPFEEIVFPEIKIVEPKKGEKDKKDESGKTKDHSVDEIPEPDDIDLEDEPSDRMDGNDAGNGSNDGDDGGESDESDEADVYGEDCTLGMTGASQYAIEGRRICACGCFFNDLTQMDSVFASFKLDGEPIAPNACSPATASFELPPDLGPGMHEITYSGPNGTDKIEFRVIGVLGEIDTNRLWLGQGTTMTLKIVGTEEAMPLLIENRTPSIIAMTGGNRQVVRSSGGASNQIERQVVGVSKGNFTIDFSLDQPPCPCYQDDN